MKIAFNRKSTCEIVVTEKVWEILAGLAARRRLFVLTDETVYGIYRDRFDSVFPTSSVYTMSAGEAYKTPEVLLALLKKMADEEVLRGDLLVAVGGGVVTDLGGLAASLYMRGIECAYVPTTLLAQVDASVGGKTAVDFCGVKNLLGTFSQPRSVYIDPSFLATLPLRELRSGLGEIVKHAALFPALYERLSAASDFYDVGFLGEIVPLNLAFKAQIAEKDPMETGIRKCLNLGHTTAHMLELSSSDLSHGEAVLNGLILEAEIAKRTVKDADVAFLCSLQSLCRRALGDAEPVKGETIDLSLARLDKKNVRRGEIVLTLPVRCGEYRIVPMDARGYEDMLKEILQS